MQPCSTVPVPTITVGFLEDVSFMVLYFEGIFISTTQEAQMTLSKKWPVPHARGTIRKRGSQVPPVDVFVTREMHIIPPASAQVLVRGIEERDRRHASIKVRTEDGTTLITVTYGSDMCDRSWRTVYGSILKEIREAAYTLSGIPFQREEQFVRAWH